MPTATGMLRTSCLALALVAQAPVVAALDATRADVREFAAEMRRKHDFDAAWLDAVLADADHG